MLRTELDAQIEKTLAACGGYQRTVLELVARHDDGLWRHASRAKLLQAISKCGVTYRNTERQMVKLGWWQRLWAWFRAFGN